MAIVVTLFTLRRTLRLTECWLPTMSSLSTGVLFQIVPNGQTESFDGRSHHASRVAAGG